MKYNRTFGFFSAALLVLILSRIIMKIFMIDTSTGFLIQSSWIATLYMTIVAAAIAAIALTSNVGKSELSCSPQPDTLTGIFAIITGLAIGGNAVYRFIDHSVVHPLIVTPKWLNTGELIFSAIASLSLLYIGINFMITKKATLSASIASLAVAVWQAMWSIIRFAQFMQVTTVSDNLLEALSMVCASMFWIYQSYSLSGIPKKNISGRTITLGLSTAIFCLPLSIAQISALVFFKSEVTGPSLMNSAMLLAIGVYTLLFSMNISKCKNSVI